MQSEEKFRKYLGVKRKKNTIDSIISRCNRISREIGDLDEAYDKDRCKSLINCIEDGDRLRINGDIKEGTNTLRSAVNRYIEFRNWQYCQ